MSIPRLRRSQLTIWKIMVAVAIVAVACAWPLLLFPLGLLLLGVFRPRIALTIVAWNAACLAMVFIYGYTIAPVIDAAYKAWFGDIQASDGRYGRIMLIAALLIVPLLPTFMSVRLYDAFADRSSDWKRVTAFSVAWQLLLLPVLVCSYIYNFQWTIYLAGNKFFYVLGGFSSDIFSFLLCPSITWLVCTVPVGAMVLWLYSRVRTPAPKNRAIAGVDLSHPPR